ncbi:unnamed protein product [Prunus armeniaca]
MGVFLEFATCPSEYTSREPKKLLHLPIVGRSVNNRHLALGAPTYCRIGPVVMSYKAMLGVESVMGAEGTYRFVSCACQHGPYKALLGVRPFPRVMA